MFATAFLENVVSSAPGVRRPTAAAEGDCLFRMRDDPRAIPIRYSGGDMFRGYWVAGRMPAAWRRAQAA